MMGTATIKQKLFAPGQRLHRMNSFRSVFLRALFLRSSFCRPQRVYAQITDTSISSPAALALRSPLPLPARFLFVRHYFYVRTG